MPLLSGVVLNRAQSATSSSSSTTISSLFSNLYCDTEDNYESDIINNNNQHISASSNNEDQENINSAAQQTSSSSSTSQETIDHSYAVSNSPYRFPTLDISPSHYPSSSGAAFLNYTKSEVSLSKLFITYWVHFAAYG